MSKGLKISVRGNSYTVKMWLLKGTPGHPSTDASKYTWKLVPVAKPEKAEYLSLHNSQGDAVLWIEPRYFDKKTKTWEEFVCGKTIEKLIYGPFSSIEEAAENAWK